MPGHHLGPQQERAALGLSLQLRDPLGGLAVQHARVVQAGHREDRRVGLRGHVLVGRVGLHVRVDLGVVQRIPPLLPLAHRQRQRRVEDRGERVDERHLRNDAAEVLRGDVRDRAHQQAAGRAAARDQPRRRRPARARQVLGARDEVGEGVLLVQQLAVLVPAAAHLPAAADVRDRVAEAAVEQRQPADGEARVHRDLVAAVAVQQERRAAIAGSPLAAHQRDRDPGAVGGGRPLAVLLVVAGTVLLPAGQRQHRLALEQGELAGGHVAVVDRVRRDQRDVAEPQRARVVLRIAAGERGEDRLGERDLVLAAATGEDPHAGEPVPAERHRQVIGERVHVEQACVGAVRNQRRPGRRVR